MSDVDKGRNYAWVWTEGNIGNLCICPFGCKRKTAVKNKFLKIQRKKEERVKAADKNICTIAGFV